jgi:PAS domain S-box-containing protein
VNDAPEAIPKELERFFDLSTDLMGIGALDGNFKRVNLAFERTLGYSRQELLSRSFLDIVHPADRSMAVEILDEFSGGDAAAQFENRCVRSDGFEVWLEWNVVADQGLVYVAGRDVTKRRREQDRLREAQRMLEASRDGLGLLAEQQASLRRVATLVARGVPPPEVFSAVAAELARVLYGYTSALIRYQPDGASELLAARDEPRVTMMPVGERFPLEGESVAAMVFRTGRPARLVYENAPGSAAVRVRELGLRSGVGAPIVVDGRLWGAAIIVSSRTEAMPPDTEARVADFADLVATTIANAEAREQLTSSRARIVAAADGARRRFERDLHDGAQQRLVSLGLQLRTAEASVPSELHQIKEQISDIATGLVGVFQDLREISRGLHPAILSNGGLGPALTTLARRSAIPVQLDLAVDRRLPEHAEVAAYYVVAEALTNAAKHARASQVNVNVETAGANVHLSIRDDGIGGADTAKGSGLIGLLDRVEALGGTMEISSHAGKGTSLVVKVPYEVR